MWETIGVEPGTSVLQVEGDRGGRRPGEKGGRRCTRGERRGGWKWDSQGGGKREKKGKLSNIAQYFAIEKMQRGGSQQIHAGNRD